MSISTLCRFDSGREAAAFVTRKFVPPIRLEFEKVFCPFLLMNKKRYAGLLFKSPAGPGRLDSKGIEVRFKEHRPLV